MVVAAVVLLYLVVIRGDQSSPAAASITPSVTSSPSVSSSPAASSTPSSPSSTPKTHQTPKVVRGVVPTGLVASSVGVDARVVPISTVGEVLTPPGDVSQVGWWADGARAGSSQGTVLLTGHTVHTGGGVFNDLADLRPDQVLTVDTAGGTVRYRVDRVRYLTKDQLSAAAPSLFDPTGRAQLVLVTCESWDGAGYDGNTVVVATPVTPA